MILDRRRTATRTLDRRRHVQPREARGRSTRTFHDYPTSWRLTAPSAGLDLTIDAAFADQEFITVISKPAFWEGRCRRAAARSAAARSRASAYIERSGFENIDTLDEFFSAVGKEVRRSVAALRCRSSRRHDELRELIASEERRALHGRRRSAVDGARR